MLILLLNFDLMSLPSCVELSNNVTKIADNKNILSDYEHSNNGHYRLTTESNF